MRKLTRGMAQAAPSTAVQAKFGAFGWNKLQEVQVQDISAALGWLVEQHGGESFGGWRGCTKAARRCTETRGRRCYFESIELTMVVFLPRVGGAGHDDSVL
jgi:hypothetical protein